MKKTMMYLPEEMHRYLAREAEARGVSMAEIAREAISEYRTRRAAEGGHAVAALIGVVDDADPATDLALSVDDVLADHYAEGGEWEREHGVEATD